MKQTFFSTALIAALLLLASTAVFAQTSDSETSETDPAAAQAELIHRRFPEALGVQAGQISGIGLTYQRWFGDLGFQIAGGALYLPRDPDSETDFIMGNMLDYSIGVELQRSVYARNLEDLPLFWQLYIVGGLNHRGYIEVESEWITTNDVTMDGEYDHTIKPYVPVIGAGFGIGLEFVLFEHLSMPIEFQYGGFWAGTDDDLANQFSISPVPQIGLRYRY